MDGKERLEMEGILVLEDGSFYRGKGFGGAATRVGELVFNTAMAGYQETLTDPSCEGQVINFTYPLIGNYGVSDADNQSDRIHAFGLIARDISFRPSNRMSEMTISEWLEQQGVPGVYNVDTRAITKKIRTEGTLKCVISTEGIGREAVVERMNETPLRADYMREAGTKSLQIIPPSAQNGGGKAPRIAVLDFGVSSGALEGLARRGCELYRFPYGTTAEEMLAAAPDGLFLPDGPGDPAACAEGIKAARALMEKLPVFGVGLGHQVLALAGGGRVFKLKFGHHGGNHGVIDLETGRSVITAQGHTFTVDPESLREGGMIVTHLNLNDGTVEGLRHESLPVFSVQFHPEGPPGPNDSKGLIDRFVSMTRKGGGLHA